MLYQYVINEQIESGGKSGILETREEFQESLDGLMIDVAERSSEIRLKGIHLTAKYGKY